MSKLPTAYQTLNHHLSRVGLTLTTAHESILLDAIESHTAAHTAALEDRIKELEAENARYREALERIANEDDEPLGDIGIVEAKWIAKEALKQQ